MIKRWLFRAQYKYRNFGIDNLMMYISVTMLAVYMLQFLMNVNIYHWLTLSRAPVLQGQVWRLLTFVFIPPSSNGIFWLLLSLYVYYFLGNSLEQYWGKFYFTVYYVFGVIGAVIAAMMTGYGTNEYINTSLLLAYAQLFPNQEFRLFFFIPVKVKYIGYVTWFFYLSSLVFSGLLRGNWAVVGSLIAALINFFIFFGPDFIDRIKENRKYAVRRRQFKKDSRDFRDRF